MSLEFISITNFRNLAKVRLELDPRFNFVIGSNGSGKTSLLDALYFLSSTRSFTTNSRRSFIMDGKDECIVRGDINRATQPSRVGVSRSRAGASEIRINGEKIFRSSQLASCLPTIVLSPESINLLLGSPVKRRSFMNWGTFHVEPLFKEVWERANRCLKQRNFVLQCKRSGSDELASWTDGLIKNSLKIHEYRTEYIQKLKPIFFGSLEKISGLRDVELYYFRGWDEKTQLKELFDKNSEIDMEKGYTSVGFHRADLKLFIRGKPATETCSRGELKALVWALKLAQSRFLSEKKTPSQNRTILLVDDLGAEFDGWHRQRIQEYLYETGHQTIITAVDQSAFSGFTEAISSKLFHVERGKIRE
ncbi:DNA replication/repair protein RecF [Gammaproteobacteria bacterium]|nr:DNA replication/repair protein RecF [Gammaproteobacteria bacterium]